MRILHINITCGRGSTGKIVRDIHERLLSDGDESYIAYRAGKTDVKNAFTVYNKVEYSFVRACNKFFGKSRIYSALPTMRLIRKIKKINPDIIHLHNIHHFALDWKKLFEFLAKYDRRVVITIHDCWLFTGGCYYYTSYGCGIWLTDCARCTRCKEQLDCKAKNTEKNLMWKKKYLSLISKMEVVAVSDWLKSEAEKSYLNRFKPQCIHNGIDVGVFQPTHSDKLTEKYKGKRLVLGVAAAWTERKGLGKFFELADILDDKYVIVLVGEYCGTARHDKIEFIQSTASQTELAQYYTAADVFVNFSTEETFGLVTAEAMACGTPVIAYASTACDEIVEECCGRVITTDTPMEKVSEIIDELASNKSKYSDDCISNIRNNYTKEIMIENYINLYKNDETRNGR